MADISITVPDSVVTRVLDAFASRFGYATNKNANETRAQFAKRMLAGMVKQIVVAEEANAAANTAYDSAATSATTDISVS